VSRGTAPELVAKQRDANRNGHLLVALLREPHPDWLSPDFYDWVPLRSTKKLTIRGHYSRIIEVTNQFTLFRRA
jgi:hypothetical protein